MRLAGVTALVCDSNTFDVFDNDIPGRIFAVPLHAHRGSIGLDGGGNRELVRLSDHWVSGAKHNKPKRVRDITMEDLCFMFFTPWIMTM